MTGPLDVAVIGAGPYGLSLAAHLRPLGLNFRIFGEPMIAWHNHMPHGMCLKSDGSSSSLFDPGATFTLAQFAAARGLPYDDKMMPVPLATFTAYGDAFCARFAPHVERKMLVALTPTRDGYSLKFDDGELAMTRNVVLAVGILPFAHIPLPLSALPPEFVSHSSAHASLARFRGRSVVVVGGGSSAIDLAALLHREGASVTMLARAEGLHFSQPPLARRTLLQRLRAPDSGIGGSWKLRLCADYPQIIHALPPSRRVHLVRNTLGPSGGYFIKDDVVGRVPLKLGRRLASAEVRGDRVLLEAESAEGGRETLEAEHVIAATGYKIDLSRLGFLGDDMRSRINTTALSPALSLDYETSLPGLYVVGVASTHSFGPVMRFVVGAAHPSRRLARVFSKLRRRAALAVSVAASS
jgi:thioredoxin reductase